MTIQVGRGFAFPGPHSVEAAAARYRMKSSLAGLWHRTWLARGTGQSGVRKREYQIVSGANARPPDVISDAINNKAKNHENPENARREDRHGEQRQ